MRDTTRRGFLGELVPLTTPAGARWLREAVEAGHAELVRAFALPPEVVALRPTRPGMAARSTEAHGAGRRGGGAT